MPIERRIRQGAERNAGVLDPDVDRFLDSVVHKTRRRQVVRRSLSAAASVAAVVLVVALGPSVLHGIGGTTNGSGARIRADADGDARRAPGDRHVHPVDPGGDRPGAGQRHRRHMDDQRRGGRACAAGCSRLVRRSACVSSVRDAGGYPQHRRVRLRHLPRARRPGPTAGRARGTSSSSRRSPTRATRASSSWARILGPSPRNACSNGWGCRELGYAARFGHGTRPRALLLRWLGRREREASAA